MISLHSPARLLALLLAASSSLLGCDAASSDSGGDIAGGKTDELGSEPVRLRFASTAFDPTWFGVIDIDANAGSNKEVTVIWTADDGTVTETPAQFLSNISDSHPDHQLWSFQGVGNGEPGLTELFIRYRVTGNEFESERYEALLGEAPGFGVVGLSAPVGKGLDIAVIRGRVTPLGAPDGVDLDILVRNKTFHKKVEVVYTTDEWKTVERVAATYLYGGAESTGRGGAEHWAAHFDLAIGEEAQFAVMAKQNGHQAWDNNFAQNFGCLIDTAPESVGGGCWGEAFSIAEF